jgi:folate-binding protein YgfZ
VSELSVDESYRLLRMSAGAFRWARDVVEVAGPDAATYLQGQTSQDVAGLGPGQSAWTLVLQPQGRLEAFARVTRVDAERFVLDVDRSAGPALVDRLSRFRLRTKVDIGMLAWDVLAVRGPDCVVPADASMTAEFRWGMVRGFDLMGPHGTVSFPDSAVEVGEAAWEVIRIEAGFPKAGAELDDRTIPAEAGLVARSVSFSKGCYTGQELVARIDSRGSNVPRRLRALRSPHRLEAGWPLASLGREVGRVTSAAVSPELGCVGLGYVARGVNVPATLDALGGSAEIEVRVEALPDEAGDAAQ